MVNELRRFIEEGNLRIHFVGIKGVGVVGLATLFHESGAKVTGSDTDEDFFTDEILESLGIAATPFNADQITKDLDLVIRSSAYGDDNPEIQRANELGVPITSYGSILADLFNSSEGLVVTGSHGKTTSAAMLAHVLTEAGWDPSAVIGGMLNNWQRTARNGQSPWMVIEGDEYQEKILALRPHAAIITNIEYDHPDFYSTEEAYVEMFRKFVWSLEEKVLLVIQKDVFLQLNLNQGDVKARVAFIPEMHFSLNVLGEHNQKNAAGVYMLCCELGIDEQTIKDALISFAGTKRRLEFYTSEDADIVCIDDYAHHPTEIKASLAAVRKRFPDRLLYAIFQPHTYSRTAAFLTEFAASFTDADKVAIIEVYGSARESKGTVTGEQLAMLTREKNTRVKYFPSLDIAISKLKKEEIPRPAVVVSLGAGDVWKIVKALSEQFTINGNG